MSKTIAYILEHQIDHVLYRIKVKLEKEPNRTIIQTALPSGTEVRVSFCWGTDVIERKAKVLGRNVRVHEGKPQPVRLRRNNSIPAQGEFFKVPVEVPTVWVTLSGGIRQLTARACCKWKEVDNKIVQQDSFNRRQGMRLALKHLLHPCTDRDSRNLAMLLPNSTDYAALLHVCMAKPPSAAKIARMMGGTTVSELST
ncbi:MAG: hypothetical protein KGL39_00250 [Patescibacteria group bacterium]|nr:hypothetical protein [Patescibacteria group bacterium]